MPGLFLNANSKINIHSNCEFCTLDSFNTLYRGFSMDGGLEGRIFKMVFSFYPFSVNFLHFSKFFHGTLCIYLSLCDWLTDRLCHGILRRNNEDTINSFTTLTNERESPASFSLPPTTSSLFLTHRDEIIFVSEVECVCPLLPTHQSLMDATKAFCSVNMVIYWKACGRGTSMYILRVYAYIAHVRKQGLK